ncbi:NUDIX hydrolase [Allostreptomyces psammosilenae]|uniref:ADP-ribose pyrophosphatase YjhB (NUDIX family) n=1 Tax=Allostreptomyces psammosilenae TaxID=1892865 RepID=A0A853A711_9ACTN|nr:NUDIX domain-containing protein [Allostreptomyces psammosilenae]NYI06461.1 ADP-ribose pyrophosphatase YjhB (NUDIX family) [Allostreptomyces psammosilenae]
MDVAGGAVELSETPQDGVRREILEETGIEVNVGPLTGVYKNLARGIVALVFRCTPLGGTERTSDESTAVAWLKPDEIPSLMSEVYAIRLLDALTPDIPHVRSHDGRHLFPR